MAGKIVILIVGVGFRLKRLRRLYSRYSNNLVRLYIVVREL